MKEFIVLDGAPVLGDAGNNKVVVAITHSPKLLREVLEFAISYLLSETAIYRRSVNYPFTISTWKKGRNTFATYHHHDYESAYELCVLFSTGYFTATQDRIVLKPSRIPS